MRALRGYTAIAEFLGLKPMHVKALVKDGTLPTFKRHGRVCADPVALLEWARIAFDSYT